MAEIDREKVIKGLECHKKKMVCMNHCPYCDGSGSTDDCTDKLIAEAFTLLKEQEPKPIAHTDNPYTGLPVARCPKCGKFARQFHSAIDEETHFCPWCGQAVKWE